MSSSTNVVAVIAVAGGNHGSAGRDRHCVSGCLLGSLFFSALISIVAPGMICDDNTCQKVVTAVSSVVLCLSVFSLCTAANYKFKGVSILTALSAMALIAADYGICSDCMGQPSCIALTSIASALTVISIVSGCIHLRTSHISRSDDYQVWV